MIIKVLRSVCIKILIIKGRRDVNQLKRNAANALKINERLLFKIIDENKNTEYGRKYDFAHIKSIEDFRNKVPLTSFEDYADYVNRIYYKDEQNILTKARVIGFSRSSGSVGIPKIIPLTKPAVRIYTKYTVTRFLALADEFSRSKGKRIKCARGISGLPRFTEVSPCGLPSTNVADVASRKYCTVYPFILNLPTGRQFLYDDIDNKYAQARFGLEDRDSLYLFSVFSKTIAELIGYIEENWKLLVKDIELGTIDPSIKAKEAVRRELLRKLKPNPKRAEELTREFEKGFDETILSRIWPNMSVISTIGTSRVFEHYTNDILKNTNGIAFDYSIYGASEGLYAASYKYDYEGQLMLVDSCYYEFIELSESGEEIILDMDRLEAGKEYEIVITNQMGLYRYRIGDVIRVLGFEDQCPVINFSYRKGQLLNISGEKTTYNQMAEAIKRLSVKSGINIRNWIAFVDRENQKFRYGMVLDTNGVASIAEYSERFEEILREVNTSYQFYESKDLIAPPKIYIQSPNAHEDWKKMKIDQGASPEQVKPVNLLDTDEKKDFFLSRLL